MHTTVLADWPKAKVEELILEPGCCSSMHRCKTSAKFWFVVQGQASVYDLDRSSDADLIGVYSAHEHTFIGINQWHQLCNHGSEVLKVLEIQYGEQCHEQDIERK